MPEGNRFEAAALAKLQIEVVLERSTDGARAALAAASSQGVPFDLVISDWSRRGEPAEAGIALLRRMRVAGQQQLLILYHGEFDPGRRFRRAGKAQGSGASGEAVLPNEWMALALQALRR